VSGLSIVATSLTEFELTGLPSVNDAPGAYSVGIDLTLLNRHYGENYGYKHKSPKWNKMAVRKASADLKPRALHFIC